MELALEFKKRNWIKHWNLKKWNWTQVCSMANIEQNNILCDSKKILLTPQNEKVFLVFHNFFWKKPSNMKSRVTLLIKCFNNTQHRTKTHLLSELWALFWLTPVRTSPGLNFINPDTFIVYYMSNIILQLCIRNILISFSYESVYIAGMMLMFMTYFFLEIEQWMFHP